MCHLIYSTFRSALVQIPSTQQIIPVAPAAETAPDYAVAGYKQPARMRQSNMSPTKGRSSPTCCRATSPLQIFKALLENMAGEQGASMTAMDNATRNAGDLIKALTIVYNRSRQAAITTELVEIISAPKRSEKQGDGIMAYVTKATTTGGRDGRGDTGRWRLRPRHGAADGAGRLRPGHEPRAALRDGLFVLLRQRHPRHVAQAWRGRQQGERGRRK